MRHHNKNRKFGRVRKVRRGFLNSLVVAFFKNESIKTTLPRAKEIRPIVEKMITRGKSGSLHDRRILLSRIKGVDNVDIVNKIINDIAPRYADRNGGYTRIVKMGRRQSDGAEMAIIQLVGLDKENE